VTEAVDSLEATRPHSRDRLTIRHYDGRTEHCDLPGRDKVMRIGRAKDNDLILDDRQTSRHHAQLRRSESGLEIIDLGSANGTLIGALDLTPNEWYPLKVGQTVSIGRTKIIWERLGASEDTLRVPVGAVAAAKALAAPTPQRQEAPAQPAPAARPATQERLVPWLALVGVLLAVILVGIGILVILWQEASKPGAGGQPPAAGPSAAIPSPSPAVALITYPTIEVKKLEVGPLMTGGLPDAGRVRLYVKVLVSNQGNAPFIVGTDRFRLVDQSGAAFDEAGGRLSEDGLRQLGLIDRYQNLSLDPGGSVPESLTFVVPAQLFRLFLQFKAEGAEPVTADLGAVDAAGELARFLGTPMAGTPAAVAQITVAPVITSITTPLPTSTRPPIPKPKTVPEASLVGTIAYPVFDGKTYDLYFGKVDGSETSLFLTETSQPQFSRDGQRIAYHSWKSYKRGLINIMLSGAEEHIIGYNLEDQLPTWSPDGDRLMFTSQRSGQRRSELFLIPANVANGDEANRVIRNPGQGEYPTWGADGRIYFKGWGETGTGLRIAQPDLSGIIELTNDGTDTAPAPSPDGKKVAFMSRRDGDWEIYIINADGKGLQQLTNNDVDDGLPTWSPDGKVIAFVSNRGGPWAIWAMNPDGTGQKQLLAMKGSPDGLVQGEDEYKTRGWTEERISWKP
jgi:TolB protein